MAYKKAGIDISYCQTSVDWNKLKTDFVIVRAGYGKYATQKDAMFETHYKNAKAKSIPVGAYWYSYALSEAEAREEAKACIAIIKGKKYEYPIYFDVENDDQFKLGRAKVSAIIKAFCNELEKAGYWAGVYTNVNWYNNVIDDDIKSRYAIWIAHWNTSSPAISGPYGLWQYKVGTVYGIAGGCDMDYSYVDYPTAIKAAGLNGYTKTTTTTTKPKTETKPSKKTITASVVVDGKTYKGTLTEV